jgi:two-component system, NtrC family, sensor kinase
MPLSRKLMLMNLALLAALALLAVAVTWGVRGMRQAVGGAADEYAELRLIEEARYHCSLAKSQMANPDLASSSAAEEIRQALAKLQTFRDIQGQQRFGGREHQRFEITLARKVESDLTALLERIEPMREGAVAFAHIQAMDAALLDLARLAEQTDIVGASRTAAERTITTLILIGVMAAIVVLGSLLASAMYYWSVMNPLGRLHGGVRRIASGEFGERLDERGSREFAELAADFNHMASELATLYTDLETKVQSKSQELVRSERLASVGFLAAGVAHEINNPLNVMSGYAEMARGWLENARRNGNLDEIRQALDIIRDEAFRCKEITGKLLSLATVGDSERGEIVIPRLIFDVVALVRGLRKYRDRTLIVDCGQDDEAHDAEAPVHGNAAEIKQVLLNLMINALEAVPSGIGEVRVDCRRRGSTIEIAVSDNGVGMTPEVRERVFEPFFSARRQQANQHHHPPLAGEHHGVGLGLSITHAIITSHGGRITAESDGPGQGSRFTIELPVSDRAPAPSEAFTHAH